MFVEASAHECAAVASRCPGQHPCSFLLMGDPAPAQVIAACEPQLTADENCPSSGRPAEQAEELLASMLLPPGPFPLAPRDHTKRG